MEKQAWSHIPVRFHFCLIKLQHWYRKIKRSSGTNLWYRKCTCNPPAPQATVQQSEREWHRWGFTCLWKWLANSVWRLRTRMGACHSLWYGCDVPYSYKIKNILEYGKGLRCQSSDWHKKICQQHKKEKRRKEICWKLQINSYLWELLGW